MHTLNSKESLTNFIDEHTVPIPETGCLLLESVDDDFVILNGDKISTDCLAYEASYGPIPKDKLIVHECHNACCINPSHMHLEKSTHH